MAKFVVGTYNLSVGAVTNRPEQVLDDLEKLMKDCHVLILQEGGEAYALLKRAEKRLGVKVFFGYGAAGQSSTPIMYRSSLKVKARKAYLLTKATYVGPAGAGPNTLKQKWLMAIKVKFNGRTVWVGNMHTSPSVYIPVREELVREQFNDAANVVKRWKGVKYVGGDLNTLPEDPLRNPLERAGLRSSQLALGRHNTMGGRNIDDIYFLRKDKRIQPLRNYEVPGASDHDAYVLVSDIEPTVFKSVVETIFKKD